MEITFLGTSSMVPTRDRNQSGVFLSYKTEGMLFDCGEGIQRQFKTAGAKMTAVTKVLLSHWHGDHVLGLPGLVQTLSATDYNRTLEIYGPRGTKDRIAHLFKAFVFDKNIELTITEVREGRFYDGKDFALEALPMEHGIETLGYAFIEKDRRKILPKKLQHFGIRPGPIVGKLQEGHSVTVKGTAVSPNDVSTMEKGKKVAYITDTRLCENCFALAHQADILICEATYASSLEGKGEEYSHMTASQAAQIAARAGVGRLYLTHFSARYKDVSELEEEARQKFPESTCAYDFLKIKV